MLFRHAILIAASLALALCGPAGAQTKPKSAFGWSTDPNQNALVDPAIPVQDGAAARSYMPALRGVMSGVAQALGTRGTPGGLATLDGTSTLPLGQLPKINGRSLPAIAAAVQTVTPAEYGTLYGDGQQKTCTASIAAGSNSLNLSGAGCSFSAADVGKSIRVQNAGVTEAFGTLTSIPVTNPGAGYQFMPTVGVSNNGDGAVRVRPQMRALSATVASGGASCGGSASFNGTMLFGVQPFTSRSGNGRPTIVSMTITNGVAGAPTIVDAGLYVPSTGSSPWDGLPSPSGVPMVPVGAVATATLAGGTISSVALSNITTAPYTVAPVSPNPGTAQASWIYASVNGSQPFGMAATLDGSGKLTGISLANAFPGQGINGPVGVIVPAPTTLACATNPTVNLNFGVAALTVQDAGAQLPLTGVGAFVSDGGPSTQATFGAGVVTPVVEYLSSTIAAVSGSTLTLADTAATAINGQPSIVNWFHDDLPAIQACGNSLKACAIPPGSYWLSGHYEPAANSSLSGLSSLNTKLTLAAGTNDDLIRTANFHALYGTGSQTVTDGVGIARLGLDGNPGAQVQWNPDRQNAIALYGSGMVLQDLQLYGAKGHGLRTDYQTYGGGGGQFRSIFTAPGGWFGRHGWDDRGPHDQVSDGVSLVDGGQEGDDLWYGVWTHGPSSGVHTALHPWHQGYITNRVTSSLRDETGAFTFAAGELEGGRNNVFFVNGGSTIAPGSKLYAHFGSPGSALQILTGSSAKHLNVLYQGTNYAPWYAIQLGTLQPGVTTSTNQWAQADMQQFSTLGPFNLANSGGGNTFQGTGAACCSGTTTTTGYNAGLDSFNYSQGGGVSMRLSPAIAESTIAYVTANNVVAAGTTQTTATQLGYGSSRVTSGAGGVKLPAVAVGARAKVLNTTGSAITVYVSTGAFDVSFAASKPLPAGSIMTVECIDGVDWVAITQSAN